MCQGPASAIIWSQPWVTALPGASYLWLWFLWGGLNRATDVQRQHALYQVVGVLVLEDPLLCDAGK